MRVKTIGRWVLMAMLGLAGCTSAPPPASDPLAEVVSVKLLATVYISPTPNDAERQATQAAIALLPTPIRATPVPSATPYVGIFMGETGNASIEVVQNVEPARFVTSLPTPFTTECEIQPDAIYGTGWQNETRVSQTLGCPGETAATYDGATQVFENGVMYFIPSGEVWAVAIGLGGGDYWYVPEAPPAQPEGISAPEGLRVPAFGFGAVWAAVPGVRQRLGFARTDEANVQIVVQRFTGGVMLHDRAVGQTFALIGASGTTQGTGYGPYQQ
jgi:hypothetical protein